MIEGVMITKVLGTVGGLVGSYAGAKVAKVVLKEVVLSQKEDIILKVGIACLTGAAGSACAQFVSKQVEDGAEILKWTYDSIRGVKSETEMVEKEKSEEVKD